MSNLDSEEGFFSLSDFICEKYGGNHIAFARDIGVQRNQIQQWLNAKKPVYVVDGKLVQVIREIKS